MFIKKINIYWNFFVISLGILRKMYYLCTRKQEGTKLLNCK